MLKKVLLLTLLIIPITPYFKGFSYEQTKILLFIFLISVTAFSWIKGYKHYKFYWTPLKLLSVFFLIALGVSSYFGNDLSNSLTGDPPYFQGVVVYYYLVITAILVSSVNINKKELNKLFSITSIVVSLVAISQSIQLYIFGQTIPTYAGRVVSTFGQPNFYSGFLLITLPFSYYLQSKWRWVVLGLSTAALLLSQSKTAIVLFILIVAIFLIHKYLNKWLVGLTYILIIILALGYSFYSIKYSTGLIHQEIIQPYQLTWIKSNSPEKRVFIYNILWEKFLEKPILGYGLDNVDSAWNSFEKVHEQRSPAYYGLKNLSVDRSHNYLLDLLIYSGVVGTLIYLVLVISLIKRSFKTEYFIPLITYLIWIQFQNQSIVHLIFFWLTLGMLDKTIVDRG